MAADTTTFKALRLGKVKTSPTSGVQTRAVLVESSEGKRACVVVRVRGAIRGKGDASDDFEQYGTYDVKEIALRIAAEYVASADRVGFPVYPESYFS